MNIDLQSTSEGVLIAVRAHAGARRNELKGGNDGAIRVSVTQAPEKGKANKAIVEYLAQQLGLRKSQLAVVAGETSPQKKVLAREIALEELRERIATALG